LFVLDKLGVAAEQALLGHVFGDHVGAVGG
jgi:hypothetical protein